MHRPLISTKKGELLESGEFLFKIHHFLFKHFSLHLFEPILYALVKFLKEAVVY